MREQPDDAAGRASSLRERLIQVAYALHFSAADAAGLFERNVAVTRLPTERDPALSAKGWRVVSERALEIVETWQLDEAPRPPTEIPAQRASQRTPNGRTGGELSDAVVRHLFSAGLELQRVAEHTQGPSRRHLSNAIDEIDLAIRDIRTASFNAARNPDTAEA